MKSSIIYTCIGFFIIILAGIMELKYLNMLTEDFTNMIDEIDNYKEFDKKAEKIVSFREKWEKNNRILSMFIDHQDINRIESELVEIETNLKNSLMSSQISTNFARLKLYIKDITDERRFILQNVL